jgi:hypothetical protein
LFAQDAGKFLVQTRISDQSVNKDGKIIWVSLPRKRAFPGLETFDWDVVQFLLNFAGMQKYFACPHFFATPPLQGLRDEFVRIYQTHLAKAQQLLVFAADAESLTHWQLLDEELAEELGIPVTYVEFKWKPEIQDDPENQIGLLVDQYDC